MRANGPIGQPEPMTQSIRCELTTRARSPTKALRRYELGPISQAAPDRRAAEEVGPGVDDRVPPDLDAPVDVRRRRILDRDSGQHKTLEQPAAHGAVDEGQLDARVDAETELGVFGRAGRDAMAGVDQQVHDVGEVELALVVVRGEASARAARRGALRKT